MSNEEVAKVVAGVFNTAQMTMEDYENQFKDMLEQDNRLISIPAEWLDYNFLLTEAIRLGFIEQQDLSPFEVTQEFKDHFGDAHEHLSRFINLTFRVAVTQLITAFVSAGFLSVTGLDDKGNAVYAFVSDIENPELKAKAEGALELVKKWSEFDS